MDECGLEEIIRNDEANTPQEEEEAARPDHSSTHHGQILISPRHKRKSASKYDKYQTETTSTVVLLTRSFPHTCPNKARHTLRYSSAKPVT